MATHDAGEESEMVAAGEASDRHHHPTAGSGPVREWYLRNAVENELVMLEYS